MGFSFGGVHIEDRVANSFARPWQQDQTHINKTKRAVSTLQYFMDNPIYAGTTDFAAVSGGTAADFGLPREAQPMAK